MAAWAVMASGVVTALLCAAALGAAFMLGRAAGRSSRAPNAVQSSRAALDLATAAHEMRTPLSGVIGASELLLGTALSPEQRTYARSVEGSARAMLALVDDLLDFSEAGDATAAPQTIQLAGLIEEIAELLAPRAQAKGLDFAALIGPGAPVEIIADEARLRQILLNLSGNAIKFTASGGVGLRVDRAEDGLRFTVLDTGPGFDPRDAEWLFGQFSRAPDAPAGGAGLGLAISRRLAEAMGGRLIGDATPGKGAAFVLTLPCWGRDEPAGPVLAGQRIAVVSGAPFSGPWLAEGLATQGAAATLVSPEALGRDPAEALAKFRPDLVMVDRAAGDASELAAIARRCGAAQVLLMLSPAERGDLERLSADGFDGYLVKPIRAVSLVMRLLGGPGETPSGSESAPAMSFPASAGGLKVLVAEDDPVSALIALAHLSKLGHAAVHVGDGAAACASFEAGAFDAVLLDVRMPVLDGCAAARRMRVFESAAGREPALILALTANGGAEDNATVRAAGMDELLVKPLDRQALEALLAPRKNAVARVA